MRSSPSSRLGSQVRRVSSERELATGRVSPWPDCSLPQMSQTSGGQLPSQPLANEQFGCRGPGGSQNVKLWQEAAELKCCVKNSKVDSSVLSEYCLHAHKGHRKSHKEAVS